MLLEVAHFLCIAFGSYYFWTWKKLWNAFGRPNVGWKDVFVTYSFKKQYRENSFKHESQMEQKIHFLIGLCGRNLDLCCFINSKPPQSDVSLGRRENRGINRINSESGNRLQRTFRQPNARTLLFSSFHMEQTPLIFAASAKAGKENVQIKRSRVLCYLWNHSFYCLWCQCLSVLLLWCYF